MRYHYETMNGLRFAGLIYQQYTVEMESALKFKAWSLKFIEALNEAKMFIDNII